MKQQKSVLCSLNSKYIHSSLGVWCLFAASKEFCKSGTEIKVVEGTINEDIELIIARLLEQKADIISFSCYIWNITNIMIIAEKIKQISPNTTIILGGPEVSYNQVKRLNELEFIDYILAGEGEKSFSQLMDALYYQKDIDKVAGLAYRRGENVITNPVQFLEPHECISPYTQEYFAALSNRIAYIESSRGCPFSCAFCLSGRCGGVRFYPLERTFKEMLDLVNHGVKTVKFVDRTFNCNKKRSIEIFKFIGENYGKTIPKDVCFHFEIAADILDDETLDIIGKLPVGSVQFEAGIQTLNSDTLAYINRKTNMKKLDENLKKLISFGNCHVHIDLIAGLPLEGLQSFIAGFNEAYYLKSSMLQLGFLKILHGSPMDQDKQKYPCEYKTTPPYEVIKTPWISEEELETLRAVEDALERLYNSGRFPRTLEYILAATAKTPFEVLVEFSYFLEEKSTTKIPLDKYTQYVFEFYSNQENISKDKLRDYLILDRISTNSSTIIPKILHIQDKRLKKVKAHIIEKYKLSSKKHSIAILYSLNKVAFCVYDCKHPVTGQFEVNILDFDEFEEIF